MTRPRPLPAALDAAMRDYAAAYRAHADALDAYRRDGTDGGAVVATHAAVQPCTSALLALVRKRYARRTPKGTR